MFAPDEFHAACLGTHPVRLAVGPPGGGGVAVEFPRPVVVVGTGVGVDVDLAGVVTDAVPARLIYFQLVAGHLFAAPPTRDVPVLVNGEPLAPRWVRPGDEFTVAGAAVRPLNPDQQGDDPPDWHPAKRSGPGALYHLECLFPTTGSQRIAGQRAVWLIGGGPPAKLQLPSTELAPVHVALVATPAGVWAVNLAAAGGTTVDRVIVPFAKLRAGSLVGLGTREFRFHPATSPAAAALVAVDAPPVPAPAADMAAVLDHVSSLQQQTFQQFQQVLGSVVQMVGAVLADQRQFVKDELDRMERILADRPAPAPVPAPPALALPAAAVVPPQPDPVHVTPPVDTTPAVPTLAPRPPAADAALHAWVQDQLTGLEHNQTTLWQRLKDRLRGDGPIG